MVDLSAPKVRRRIIGAMTNVTANDGNAQKAHIGKYAVPQPDFVNRNGRYVSGSGYSQLFHPLFLGMERNILILPREWI